MYAYGMCSRHKELLIDFFSFNSVLILSSIYIVFQSKIQRSLIIWYLLSKFYNIELSIQLKIIYKLDQISYDIVNNCNWFRLQEAYCLGEACKLTVVWDFECKYICMYRVPTGLSPGWVWLVKCRQAFERVRLVLVWRKSLGRIKF